MPATPISLRLDAATSARIDRLVADGAARDRTDAIRRAVAALDDARADALAHDVWATIQERARRRLAHVLAGPELLSCLDVTRTWLVSGADAHMIDEEMSEAARDGGDEARPGVDRAALAGKLAGLSAVERAVLTLACRRWWALPEPRPGVEGVLGLPVRGAGASAES